MSREAIAAVVDQSEDRVDLQRLFRDAEFRPDTLDADIEAVRERLFPRSTSPQRIGRFSLVRLLGEGSVGAVYEAIDTTTNEVVALKIVRRGQPGTDQLLKREFRVLGEVTSPNLVQLYELGREGDTYFVTMELVRGRDFLSYVWDGSPAERVNASERLDVMRLRSAVKQLVSGLTDLHRAGKVHRDIKPSNVLVTDEGRVVILDFGLVGVCDAGERLDSTFNGQIVGTPAYMAPEQLRAEPPLRASDWYAVGGMLFHALVGRPPFSNLPLHELRDEKTRIRPPTPSDFVADVPDDLNELCASLLEPDPSLRPDGPEILERLGWNAAATTRIVPSIAPDDSPFVGREKELHKLRAAFDASRTTPIAVTIAGSGGVGKTTLVQRFLASLDPKRCAVLAAKCYEREGTPYKTVDALVDALVRYLQRLPPMTVMRLIPRHVHELAQMFPSLKRVDAVLTTPESSSPVADKHELRRRAVLALQELLGRIADTNPLVVWIDDMQWSDIESILLFKELFRTKNAPTGLFVGTYNTDRLAADRLVRRMFDFGPKSAITVQRVELEALPHEVARELASTLLTSDAEGPADQIARQAEGNPFLVAQLAAFLRSSRDAPSSPNDAFGEMVHAYLVRLSPEARDVLRVIAIARSPIPLRVLWAASTVSSSFEPVMSELRSIHAIRTQGQGDRRLVEIAHDRWSEAVLARLDRHSRRSLHARLGRALAAMQVNDHERVAFHLRSAGESDEAARHLLSGARNAANSLAFDRAARLYRLALRWGLPESEVSTVRLQLAEALRYAGYGRSAAEAYLEAANLLPATAPESRFDLQRMAAREFLLCGRLDRVRSLVDDLLASVGLTLPRNRLIAGLRLIARRLYIRLLGIRYQLRESTPSDRDSYETTDTIWMLGQGLVIYDPVIGNDLLNRNVILSLRTGDALRISRSLAFEAASVAFAGPRTRARVHFLLDKAKRAAETVSDPYNEAFVFLSSSAAAYFLGEPKRALSEAEHGERLFREHCQGVAWEQHVCNLTVLCSQMVLGRFAALTDRAFDSLDEALARGNLYQAVGLRSFTHLGKLVLDDPDGAQAEVDCVERDWQYGGFDMQHLALLFGAGRIPLYCGRGEEAVERLEALWPRFRRSLMTRAPFVRAAMLPLRGRAAAFAYAQSGRRKHRRTALHTAEQLARLELPGCAGDSWTIRAAIAAAERRESEARVHLEEAIAAYERDSMSSLAHAARYQLGTCMGHPKGNELRSEAEARLREDAIRKPEYFVQMLTGFPRRDDQ